MKKARKILAIVGVVLLVLLFLAVPSVTFLIMLRKAEADARREEEVW